LASLALFHIISGAEAAVLHLFLWFFAGQQRWKVLLANAIFLAEEPNILV
jgi:hypothetical protein